MHGLQRLFVILLCLPYNCNLVLSEYWLFSRYLVIDWKRKGKRETWEQLQWGGRQEAGGRVKDCRDMPGIRCSAYGTQISPAMSSCLGAAYGPRAGAEKEWVGGIGLGKNK